jgi:uncharacterized protein GlcG (DUF336 family)
MQSYVSLGLRESEIAMQAIREELARRGRPAVVAVAARERTPTREIGQSARDAETGFDIAYYGDPRYVGWGGGVPVVIDGSVVGSVAVSGLPETEDMELAEIGVAAIAAQVVTA